MSRVALCRWLGAAGASVLAGLIFLPITKAAEPNATFEFRPHCISVEGRDDDWLFGPIPAPGIVVNTREEDGVICTDFEVLDPERLQTKPLRVGDILDFDIIVKNPSRQPISRVRAWLSYDPTILEGELITINDVFDLITPDERGFDEQNGYAKMEASSGSADITDDMLIFARLQFRVLRTTPTGSPINFYDAQLDGHSVIMTTEGTDEAYILQEDPGVLQVVFATNEAASSAATSAASSELSSAVEPVSSESSSSEPSGPLPDGSACLRNEDCLSTLCIAGVCQPSSVKIPNGGACTFDDECLSGICGSGVCVPEITGEELGSNDDAGERTAFGLLQVRNLRATTDGTTVFLAWDPLQSSILKAYNVYYGTTSGRYIQRKTVDGTENTVTIRNLPLETTYYFAVRAVSTNDEESAFSREVAVTIGDPSSSTAPLEPGSTLAPPNPLLPQVTGPGATAEPQVPGETGLSSILAITLILCAVIGTMLIARRHTASSK